MLLFKKKFLPLIRAGTKTQTVRYWNVLRYRTGQQSYIPGVGYIQIMSIAGVQLSELTAADAQRDGFAHLAELLKELNTLYHTEPTGQLYRVQFRVLDEVEQQQAIANRKLKKSR
jgi:hypothetical protein